MIYITGDTHIPIDIHKLSVTKFPEQKQMTKSDYVIACGDFGGVWDRSKEETYWLKWLNEKPFTTLFIDGNHENFDLLNQYDEGYLMGGKVHRIMASVYHLMRGQVFTIDGLKFFTMGGATSHDKIYRKEGVSWWPQEMPSNEEYETALKSLDKYGWEVDYILSHCAPDSIQSKLADWYEHDKCTNFLETVRQDCKYKHWYFGHYHINRDVDDKHTCLYDWFLKPSYLDKTTCTKCKSENVKVCPVVDEDYVAEGFLENECIVDDLWDCHCNDCGWDFLTVNL